MSPDDPRHGTPAGAKVHWNAGQEPCDDCREGARIITMRRRKLRGLGRRFTFPSHRSRAQVLDWQRRGASQDEIAHHVGLHDSVIEHLVRVQPEMVFSKTHVSIMRKAGTMPLTSLGATRRIQGLMWLGWTAAQIAAEAGVHYETVLDNRYPRINVNLPTKVAIAAAYERLHMKQPPAGANRGERSAQVRTRNAARRDGFLPPLAWDCIDDHTERPQGVAEEASA